MNLDSKLRHIQHTLKCNKSQYNSFGKYNYRSCEDILESVKLLLEVTKTILVLSDEIVLIGDRFYVKATATLRDCESEESISTSAYAREELDKKGMDGSQVTGTSSSYARKYALNGLFCIDDTKDADTDAFKHIQDKAGKKSESKPKATTLAQAPASGTKPTDETLLRASQLGIDLNKLAVYYKKTLESLTEEDVLKGIKQKEEARAKKNGA